jgi:hypothetical protein
MPLIDIARRRRFCASVLPLGGLALPAGKTSVAGARCLAIQARGAREGMVPERVALGATVPETPLHHRRSSGQLTRLEFA